MQSMLKHSRRRHEHAGSKLNKSSYLGQTRSIYEEENGMYFHRCSPLYACSSSSGSLTDQENGGTLYFSCESDDNCQLTPVPIGEEIISGSVKPIH